MNDKIFIERRSGKNRRKKERSQRVGPYYKSHEKREILVIGADKAQFEKLCCLLESFNFRATYIDSILHFEKHLQKPFPHVAILDFDNVQVDNRKIRDLALKYPEAYIIGLCKKHYNPELKEAISYHIYACIHKPVNPDELFYWLKTICEDKIE